MARRLFGLLFLASASCLVLASAERSSSADVAALDTSGSEVSQKGQVCASVKQMVEKGEMPSDVYTLVLATNISEEYTNLIRALTLAKKGTMNVFKCSSLYRTMYIGGHEEAFLKKGMSIFLTKQEKDGPFSAFRKSLIQICFVQGDHATPPKHTYHDATEIELRGEVTIESKTFPIGVLGQPYTDLGGKPIILADKSTMPVDVLKMLDAKDAIMLHMDMAGLINLRSYDPRYARKVVEKFANQFEAKRLGVFFREKMLRFEGTRYADGTPNYHLEYLDLDEYLVDYCYWLEYLDLDVVNT